MNYNLTQQKLVSAHKMSRKILFMLAALVVACASNPPHVETHVGGVDSAGAFDASRLIPYRELTRADFQADALLRELRGLGLGAVMTQRAKSYMRAHVSLKKMVLLKLTMGLRYRKVDPLTAAEHVRRRPCPRSITDYVGPERSLS